MIRLLPAAGRTAVAWKNGGGVTREIAAWPQGAGMDDFVWRVSLAEVGADGPFSAFAEVDRTLTVVEGAGMDLTVDGKRQILDTRLVPRDFPGDVPTDCRLLDGPVVNFNVMWRRGLEPAPAVAVVRGRVPFALRPGTAMLVLALDAPAEVSGLRLEPYDAALLTDGGTVLHAAGSAAVVRLTTPPAPGEA
ncbi:HutD family protein [Streptomyces sp. NPDC005485]|uniref:HutD/Ves family protein n=1 Tax=Streptomyces sp. NPDC005485 TaxID=3155591 RepID=UPI0033B53C2D